MKRILEADDNVTEFMTNVVALRLQRQVITELEEGIVAGLPAVLARVRDVYGLTQRQMADKLGVDHTSISKIENEKLRPGAEFFYNLEAFLDEKEEAGVGS